MLTRGVAVAYYVVLVTLLITICYFTSKQHRPSSKATLKACLGGSIAGGTQFLTKAAISLIVCTISTDTCSDNPWEHGAIYVVTPLTLLFHGIAIYVLADALRKSEALVGIAMYEGMIVVMGTVSGNLVLGEACGGFSALRGVIYVLSLFTILFGLFLLIRWPACFGDGDASAVDAVGQQRARIATKLGGALDGEQGGKATEASKLVGGKRSDLVGGKKGKKGGAAPLGGAGSSC